MTGADSSDTVDALQLYKIKSDHSDFYELHEVMEGIWYSKQGIKM